MKCPQKYHELSLAAVLSLALVAFVTFAGEVAWHCGFVVCAQENLDNPDYLQLASIVRAGDLVADVPRHFWGFPAAIASLASLLHVSDLAALLVLSITTSLLTTALMGVDDLAFGSKPDALVLFYMSEGALEIFDAQRLPDDHRV